MIIEITNTICTLTAEKGDAEAPFRQLSNYLSVYAPGFKYTPTYKLYRASRGKRGWDGKVKLITHNNFATGLLPKCVDFLGNKAKVHLKDSRKINNSLIKFGDLDKSLNSLPFQLRDYQLNAIYKSFKNTFHGMWWPRGIIQLATGGGKTEVAAAMILITQVPTLFVVNKKTLLHQTVARFKKYGLDVGAVGDGLCEMRHMVTVATVQTLMQEGKGDISLQLSKDIEQVFFDEGHHLAADLQKGNIFVALGNKLPNAYMRWGLTATPFMKDKYSDNLLEGGTGKVLFTASNEELISQGYLTPPEITMIPISKDDSLPQTWPDCYNAGIIHNDERNIRIVEEIQNSDKPCMVLVSKVEHGKVLKDIVDNHNMNVEFLCGKDDQDTREKVVQKLKDGRLDCLIATTIFDEGVDIPELRTLILAGGGKSIISGLQRLGRGLRLAEGKEGVRS